MADPSYRDKLLSLHFTGGGPESRTTVDEATAATIEQTEHRDGRLDLTIKPRHLALDVSTAFGS